MQLGSSPAVAVVHTGSCSYDGTPSLGTSVCHRGGPKKTTATITTTKPQSNDGCTAPWMYLTHWMNHGRQDNIHPLNRRKFGDSWWHDVPGRQARHRRTTTGGPRLWAECKDANLVRSEGRKPVPRHGQVGETRWWTDMGWIIARWDVGKRLNYKVNTWMSQVLTNLPNPAIIWCVHIHILTEID